MVQKSSINPKVIVITGPTAIGKTQLSIEIAKKFNAEIINADASQFRRGLDIGTAKISKDEMMGVNHHLVDIINISDDYSIKEFQNDSRNIIKKLISKDILPIIVGGSGLYINSCIGNYCFEELDKIDESVYESYSNDELHDILESLDLNSSLKIHSNNRRRVIRAIELAKSGKPLSQNNDGNQTIYNALIVCLCCDREILYNRINARYTKMIEKGWVEECIKLKEEGYDISKIKDIGYVEINNYIEGKISYEQLAEKVKQKTRNYAKRQMTWFRNKMNCQYVEMNYTNLNKTVEEVTLLINNFLNLT